MQVELLEINFWH